MIEIRSVGTGMFSRDGGIRVKEENWFEIRMPESTTLESI